MTHTGLSWIAYYVAAGLASVAVVRWPGPVTIGAKYQIEETYESIESGKLNVAYRILAPTISCGLFLILAAFVCKQCGVSFPVDSIWPTIIYWVALGAMKQSANRLADRVVLFLVEAASSILLAYAFNSVVISGYLDGLGISILDSSNLASQFEVALFGVVTCWISAGYIRRRRSAASRYSTSCEIESNYYASIDTSEAKLFSYEREFGSLLPQRYSRDVLLRSLFFAIMAIEDGNRPRIFRFIERAMARFGMAKTTGIMQQKGEEPLSDKQSVELAIGYVDKMWDRYLVEFARSSEGNAENALRIYETYYCYDYQVLKRSIQKNFSKLYGDYCGTRLLNANQIYKEVLDFEERQRYGLTPSQVQAPARLCITEFGWLSGESICWSDHDTVESCFDDPEAKAITVKKPAAVSKDEITSRAAKLKDAGCRVSKVKLVDGAYAEIVCTGKKSKVLKLVGTGWRVG